MRAHARGLRGFTLIELLVVVAIIALLISILLPSLRDAREQAKIAKCLANCRNLLNSSVQYFMDNNDEFPFQVTMAGGWMGICTWTYGGKTSDDFWATYYSGLWFIKVENRPLNRYIMGALPEPDLYVGTQISKRTEVPSVACPSDRISHQRMFNGPDTDITDIGCYNDIGTSYHYNLHAMMGVNINLWGNSGQNWVLVGRTLVKQVLAKYASTYVMYLPDPLDWGLNIDGKAQTVELGYHGKFGRHELGFLDGHAEYKYMDSRNWCGTGWEAINAGFACYYGQPKPKPFYYATSPNPSGPPDYTKNCNPHVY